MATQHIRQSTGSSPQTYLTPDNPLMHEAKQYLDCLLQADRHQAETLVLNLVKTGYPVAQIYENIFELTQQELGLLWQTNRITVAHEHFCTAATQLIMSRLYPAVFDSEKKGKRLLACTMSEDLHEMGIRIVSDFFEMDGWDTYYMGANMPEENIISALKEQRPDLLALSSTTDAHIYKIQKLLSKIKSVSEISNVKIIVGGRAVNMVPAIWKNIGADGSAFNARSAVQLGNRLVTPHKLVHHE